MGFSFEDKYIRKLFDKILHHYQAQHFILFDKSEADKNAEKIERIKTQYGIETVFYDALKKGHIDGIRAVSYTHLDVYKRQLLKNKS